MSALVIAHEQLLHWIGELKKDIPVYGPILQKNGENIFAEVDDARQINLDYCTTMTSPRNFIYPSHQVLMKLDRKSLEAQEITDGGRRVIFGITPCDMHAIWVLDRTFLGTFKDTYYKDAREEVITIVLNCNRACEKLYPDYAFRGFCASMRTGPFLRIKEGYDIQLTRLTGGEFLAEAGSERAEELLKAARPLRDASAQDYRLKEELWNHALTTFKKDLDIEGLPELLARTSEHPVYRNTADSRCLNCTNCTMVCPTCYCYNMRDVTSLDLNTTWRERRWDSCQALAFAKVNGENIRGTRQARLRYFVMHKLGIWVEQFGCLGCVGCGRCMFWCPTHIDLTEMAKEIQRDEK